MKLIVKSIFCDKNDGITLYHPDTILEVNDNERAASLIERGLCAEYKGRKKAETVLSEPSDEPKEQSEEEVPEVADGEKGEASEKGDAVTEDEQ